MSGMDSISPEFGSHLASIAQEPFHTPGSGKLGPSGRPPIMACYSFIQPAVNWMHTACWAPG